MKWINPDFRTFLAFESGLIRLPVVQGTDNHWYLDHLFDGTEGVIGTLFFDVQCEMDDPVRIIYGHSVFSEPTMMFTPLHQLCSQSFFEQNRIFTLDDGETAETYEIISVFINDEALPDALDTRIRCFADDDARRAFLHDAQKRSLVHSLMHEETEGRIIILQTCMDAQAEQRLCAVALEKKG
jgi:sortase B